MKTQSVRLLEAFFVAPLMAWGGCEVARSSKGWKGAAGAVLCALGVVTFVRAAREYHEVEAGGVLPGGLGDRTKPSDVDPGELAQGILVEREHTTEDDVAREIALDHLTEDPHYYTKLATIESH